MKPNLCSASWFVAFLILAACSGSGAASNLKLISIAVTPVNLPIAVGATQTLTVIGTYSNASTTRLTSGLIFASDNTTVATVSGAGSVTAVTNGTAHVTVTDTAASLQATPVTVTVTAAPTTNTLPVSVDKGPFALFQRYVIAANILYATVTLCTPGSSTACQVIDHVVVDTGSIGVEILQTVLSGAAALEPESVNGAPLRECVAYADGYSWGSMVTADVQLGGRTVAALPVHLIGDPAAGTAPASCSSGAGPVENTASAFGANGVLGVGNFLQDCGALCASNALSQSYYACPASGCVPTVVPLAEQLTNPVGALGTDNNGIVISLPPATETGQESVVGSLYFGINTRGDNALGGASLLTVDPNNGTFTTAFNGQMLNGSVIDSGSTAYFFYDPSIATCASPDQLYYCPATSGGSATTVSLSGTLQGANGVTAVQPFTIGNANLLFGSGNIISAFPTLGGPNGRMGGAISGFDWGLPFFYGRPVFVLFEQNSIGSVTGPAVGF